MRGLRNSMQAQDDVKKLNDAVMRDIMNTLDLLLEHQMILSTPTRVVLRPFDGEKRCLKEFLVGIFLANVQLSKVALEELFADPLVTGLKVFCGEVGVEHESIVLKGGEESVT